MDHTGSVTQAEAVSAAKTFDVIVALRNAYPQYLSQMKAANPNLTLLVYAKGMFVYDTSLPESAYSHDANGRRIRSQQFGTYLLNPNSAAALSYQTSLARHMLSSSGYDGVFLDTLGVAAINPGFVTSQPINPATGRVWTGADWMAATSAMAGKTAAAIGKPVLGNGLRDGTSYYDPTVLSRQLTRTGLDAGMAEAWVRGGANPITNYPSEAVWRQNVDMLADAGNAGCSVMPITKVWTSGTQAQKDAWYEFVLATYLLGNDGHSYVSFSYDQGDATAHLKWNDLNLGTPAGPYAKLKNVYQRFFSGGLVLVNPTPNTYTVSLGGTYRTLSGAAVTSIKLTPNSAEILTT